MWLKERERKRECRDVSKYTQGRERENEQRERERKAWQGWEERGLYLDSQSQCCTVVSAWRGTNWISKPQLGIVSIFKFWSDNELPSQHNWSRNRIKLAWDGFASKIQRWALNLSQRTEQQLTRTSVRWVWFFFVCLFTRRQFHSEHFKEDDFKFEWVVSKCFPYSYPGTGFTFKMQGCC